MLFGVAFVKLLALQSRVLLLVVASVLRDRQVLVETELYLLWESCSRVRVGLVNHNAAAINPDGSTEALLEAGGLLIHRILNG